MLLAVLQQRAGCQLQKDDSYVATVGGVKLSEPATDLAVALAVASAKHKKPLPQRLIAFGEVGLAGEVRPVPGINQRIQEAHRLGFTHAVVPASPTGPGPSRQASREGSGPPDRGSLRSTRRGPPVALTFPVGT
jgi:DNA repair protein RadA/Sms